MQLTTAIECKIIINKGKSNSPNSKSLHRLAFDIQVLTTRTNWFEEFKCLILESN